MGAPKYIQELWRKKQSGVTRFLLRARCWQYRQLSALHRAPRAPHPPSKGADWIQGQARLCHISHSCTPCWPQTRVPKGATSGRPVHHGVNELKFAQRLQSVAKEQARRRCGALRVPNSYWVGEDSTYKFFRVILTDPFHKPWPREGPPHGWWFSPCSLEKAQYSPASPLPLM
uniref:Ribosomal protein L15 n=1 Tax=Equus asinus TaxID=9793 RepID=A0A9L0IC19_EQUAS